MFKEHVAVGKNIVNLKRMSLPCLKQKLDIVERVENESTTTVSRFGYEKTLEWSEANVKFISVAAEVSSS